MTSAGPQGGAAAQENSDFPAWCWGHGPKPRPKVVDPLSEWPVYDGERADAAGVVFPAVPVWLGRTGSELAARADVRLELTCDPEVDTLSRDGTIDGVPTVWVN